MKKLSLAITAFLLALPVFAQTMVKEMDGAATRFIPGCYMKNGEAAIYFSDDEYGYRDGQTCYEAEIYDFELNPLKKFYFQILHPYTIYEKREANGTKVLTREITEPRGTLVIDMPGVSDMEARKAAFISWFYEANRYLEPGLTIENLTSASRIDGTTVYISIPFSNNSGKPSRSKAVGDVRFTDYLKSYDLYLDAENMHGYIYIYATEVPVCNGEWSTFTWYDVPVSNFCTPRITDVDGMNHWNGGVYLPFSQTFFNDDDKFEYVRYKAEIVEGYGETVGIDSVDVLKELFGVTPNDRDGDGEEDYRSTRYGVKRSGLEVVAEDGSTIYTFPLPETCDGNPRIEFFKSDNSILAQIDFNWIDNDKTIHTVRFYRLDKTGGVAKVIKEENRVYAAPNPVSAGTPLRMSIPAGSKGSRTVTVTSLSGANVYSVNVDPAVTDITIPTNTLSPGMYMFTLLENGSIAGNCKILVN